jgi:adenylylsulfate kinase-like enzyme
LRGEILNFTGVDGGYEPPAAPEIHLRTAETEPEACVAVVLRKVGTGGTAI